MQRLSNVDEQEIAKFDRVSQAWWDADGEMRNLHAVNPLRTQFVLDHIDIPRPKILDVGCGGGILAEALAKAGAQVTGIDLSQATLAAARQHADTHGLTINYMCRSAEQIAQEQAASFDAVTCMEMLEHVPEPSRVIAACARTLKPGGRAFFSTINRTLKAFMFAIVVGEYVLHLLPCGSHHYKRLIRPQEMRGWAQANGLELVSVASLIYNPLTKKFRLASGREDVNYMACFIKTG